MDEASEERFNQMDWNEKRKAALAKGLGIKADDVDYVGDNTYETPEGTYLVFDAEEAEEAAREDIQDTIDEMGLDAFTTDFRKTILKNFLDHEGLKDFIRFDYEIDTSYRKEDASRKFENGLIEDMYDYGILTKSDFDKDENGKVNYKSLSDDVDLDEKTEEYLTALTDAAYGDNHWEVWLKDTYGDWKVITGVLTDNELIDWEGVKEECIKLDGIAHFLAAYDGKEIKLENGLYAYRID